MNASTSTSTQFRPRSPRRAAVRFVPVLVALLAGLLALAGCTVTTSGNPGSGGGNGAGPAASAAPQKASLELKPAAGAADVNPAGVISAGVSNGTLGAVTLRNAAGEAVQGQLSPDKRTWTATEELGYGKTYTWAGSATGADGAAVPIGGSFSTLTPAKQISGKLNVGDGQTYGVAMPIALHFSAPVTDRAAVQQALTVTTSAPVTGAWAWLSAQDVHWRPQSYYPPNTQVSVAAKLYGVQFGPGAYGKADVTSNFTIGRSQVVQGNAQTHRLVVITDGVVAADYPASFGLDSDPHRNTHSGTHVVMSKSQDYYMSSQRYNYSNVLVHWAVRLSNNGEFVHAYPASVWAQGKRNVSHGCVNLSTANGKAYYDTALIGDPVEITGTNIPLSAKDGDYYDWTLTWPQWQAASAIPA
jgi:lipoprotein-anchoring transpeptidase ErfK/SrfK